MMSHQTAHVIRTIEIDMQVVKEGGLHWASGIINDSVEGNIFIAVRTSTTTHITILTCAPKWQTHGAFWDVMYT